MIPNIIHVLVKRNFKYLSKCHKNNSRRIFISYSCLILFCVKYSVFLLKKETKIDDMNNMNKYINTNIKTLMRNRERKRERETETDRQ